MEGNDKMNSHHQKEINTLIETRINGNSLTSCKHYINMLKRITKADLKHYCFVCDIATLYGSKAEIIEQLKEEFKCPNL